MKVLHLISSGGMYGAEAVILQLCAEMNSAEPGSSTIGVFAHNGQTAPPLHEAAEHASIPSVLLPCKGQLDLGVTSEIRRLVDRLGVDVLHAHGYKADIYAHLAFLHRRRPALVSTCHTWYDNDVAVRLYGAADRMVLRSFDQVVSVSDEVRERLLRAGVPEQRVHLIRNGVATPSQSQTGESTAVATVRVGLVGRLAPEKGVDVLLRAVALLGQNMPGVQFVIAGEGPDRPALEALLRELGLSERVTLLGQQANMEAFYHSLALQVSASRQEGLPMALLEGMSRGLPVVATRVGEVPKVVVDGETGILVPPESPQALAAAMRQLLADPEKRRSYGEAGRLRVLEHFSAKRMTADYLAVYRRALRGRRTARASVQAAGGLL